MKIAEADMLEKFFTEFRELRWCPQRASVNTITFYLSKDWELILYTESIDSDSNVVLDVMLIVNTIPILNTKWTSSTITNDLIRFKFFMTALREAGRRFLN